MDAEEQEDQKIRTSARDALDKIYGEGKVLYVLNYLIMHTSDTTQVIIIHAKAIYFTCMLDT